MKYRRSVEALAVTLAAVALTACASAGPDSARIQRERTAFVVASSGWLSGSMNVVEKRDEVCRAPACPALAPQGPWLGTIGVRSHVPNSYEYGFGVCVPNPGGQRVEQQIAPDPMRTVGVGVWLKFDF